MEGTIKFPLAQTETGPPTFINLVLMKQDTNYSKTFIQKCVTAQSVYS